MTSSAANRAAVRGMLAGTLQHAVRRHALVPIADRIPWAKNAFPQALKSGRHRDAVVAAKMDMPISWLRCTGVQDSGGQWGGRFSQGEAGVPSSHAGLAPYPGSVRAC